MSEYNTRQRRLKRYAKHFIANNYDNTPVTHTLNPTTKRKPTYSTKLTPELEKQIIKMVATDGMPIESACSVVGISKAIFCAWKRLGRKEMDRVEQGLEEAIQQAIQEGVINPNDSDDIEDFIVEIMAQIKPGRFFFFFTNLLQAQEKAHQKNLQNIQRAGNGGKWKTEKILVKDAEGKVLENRTVSKYQAPQWQASAWYLERIKPDLYCPTQRQHILQEANVKHAGTIEHKVILEDTADRAADVLQILMDVGFIARGQHTGSLPPPIDITPDHNDPANK